MACVARLSLVEIDIFLTSASPGQRDIVRALREIITRRASGLAERVRSVDGSLEVTSPPRGPTVVTVDLPLRA